MRPGLLWNTSLKSEARRANSPGAWMILRRPDQMNAALILALMSAASPPPAHGAQTFDPVAEAGENPVIVAGTKAGSDEAASTVIVGSRIARKPLLAPGKVASNTPVAGLSATSGVDPLAGGNRVVRRKSKSCVSDNPAIRQQAACLLIDAEAAIKGGDRAGGIAFYRHLNASEEFSPAERLVGAERLFALGQAAADPALREEALLGMLATDALPANEAQSARRNLVAFALQRADAGLAITRLQEVVAVDADDAQSHANLAVLLRQEGLAGASEHMMRAIAIKQAKGEPVPPGWDGFVRP